MRASTLRQFRTLLALLCTLGCCLLAYIWLPRYANAEIRRAIRDAVILRPGGSQETYDRFVDSSKPEGTIHYTRFYFFNITNLAAVRRENARPILNELGPYTYRTVEQKYDLAFHWNGTLSYRERTLYFPVPDLTVGNFDDVVVTLNLALVGALQQISDHVESSLLERTLRQVAYDMEQSESDVNQGVFMTRSVEELLWGYDEPLLDTLSQFIKVDTAFSLMQNGTKGDAVQPSRIDTGITELSHLGQLESWKGKEVIDDWNHHAENVSGTSGTFFRPFLHANEDLCVWIGDIARAVPLLRDSESNLYGVRLLRYHIEPAFWRPDMHYYSQYKGLVNVTHHSAGGSKGPPLFFSPPHFCGGDPILSDGVIGLHCDVNQHAFYIDVEPNTGISLRAAARFMVSTEYASQYPINDDGLQNTILPVFWLEIYRQASEEQTEPIRVDLYDSLNMRDKLTFVVLICIVLLGIVTIAYLLRMLGNYLQQQQPLVPADYHQMDYRLMAFAI